MSSNENTSDKAKKDKFLKDNMPQPQKAAAGQKLEDRIMLDAAGFLTFTSITSDSVDDFDYGLTPTKDLIEARTEELNENARIASLISAAGAPDVELDIPSQTFQDQTELPNDNEALFNPLEVGGFTEAYKEHEYEVIVDYGDDSIFSGGANSFFSNSGGPDVRLDTPSQTSQDQTELPNDNPFFSNPTVTYKDHEYEVIDDSRLFPDDPLDDAVGLIEDTAPGSDWLIGQGDEDLFIVRLGDYEDQSVVRILDWDQGVNRLHLVDFNGEPVGDDNLVSLLGGSNEHRLGNDGASFKELDFHNADDNKTVFLRFYENDPFVELDTTDENLYAYGQNPNIEDEGGVNLGQIEIVGDNFIHPFSTFSGRVDDIPAGDFNGASVNIVASSNPNDFFTNISFSDVAGVVFDPISASLSFDGAIVGDVDGLGGDGLGGDGQGNVAILFNNLASKAVLSGVLQSIGYGSSNDGEGSLTLEVVGTAGALATMTAVVKLQSPPRGTGADDESSADTLKLKENNGSDLSGSDEIKSNVKSIGITRLEQINKPTQILDDQKPIHISAPNFIKAMPDNPLIDKIVPILPPRAESMPELYDDIQTQPVTSKKDEIEGILDRANINQGDANDLLSAVLHSPDSEESNQFINQTTASGVEDDIDSLGAILKANRYGT